jgi:ABC-type transport system involved in multi-copper enzyme maturation permease subunit
VHPILTIAHLTFLELRRRRIVSASLACGAVWLLVFATAVYLIHAVHHAARPLTLVQARVQLQLLSLAGFYAVNLLAVAVAIMLPVDTLSGEIASGVMQTLASKPVRRAEILLGKWLTFWVLIAAYIAILVTGVVLTMYLITGFLQSHAPAAAALMLLETTVLLCLVSAGGVRFTTVTNGMVAFAFYAVAMIGGWIEQIGTVMGNVNARYIGIVISLVSPTDALWRRALYVLQPPVMTQVHNTPFSPASLPSEAMVWWAGAFALGLLVLALRGFEKHEL